MRHLAAGWALLGPPLSNIKTCGRATAMCTFFPVLAGELCPVTCKAGCGCERRLRLRGINGGRGKVGLHNKDRIGSRTFSFEFYSLTCK